MEKMKYLHRYFQMPSAPQNVVVNSKLVPVATSPVRYRGEVFSSVCYKVSSLVMYLTICSWICILLCKVYASQGKKHELDGGCFH